MQIVYWKKKRKNVTTDPLLNSVLGEFCSCSTDAEMDVEPVAHASPRHRHRSMAKRPWIIPAWLKKVAAKSSWVLEYSNFLSKICIWKLNYHLFACPIRKSWLILLSFIKVWICSQDMTEQHQSIGKINVFAYQRQGVFTVSVKSKNRNHNSWHGTRFDLWPLSCW